MTFPFLWVRDPRWRDDCGQIFMLEMNPESVFPAVSVQPEWQGCKGIVRGMKDSDGFLVEDHICEELQAGRPVDTGRRIIGADEIRKEVWSVDQHIAQFEHIHPHQKVLGWVGNGNLLSNPHFVAFSQNQLFHLSSETQCLNTRSYTSLIVRKPGMKRVTIERIRFNKQFGKVEILNELDCDISSEVEYTTFGQQIVKNGNPIGTDKLKQMALDQQFYDLRHLFLFGCIAVSEKRWIDVGLGSFWDNGTLNTKVVEAAVGGGPIELDVRQFDETTIREAMYVKGYNAVGMPKEYGQFSLGNGRLKVVLLRGLYPHNIIGVRDDGTIISVVLRGLSNRLGVSITGAAEIMADLGARDALLIDNGGDVMMSFNGDQVLGSAEGGRNRLRSVLLFRREDEKAHVAANDFRLVVYPKQTAPRM